MPEKKPRLITLTFVGFQVNAAIEHERGDIVFEDVYKSLGQGRLLEMLTEKLPECDFSLFPEGHDQNVALNHVLDNASDGFEGREHKKAGIESSGLHLVLALVLEAIQRKDWVDDVLYSTAMR